MPNWLCNCEFHCGDPNVVSTFEVERRSDKDFNLLKKGYNSNGGYPDITIPYRKFLHSKADLYLLTHKSSDHEAFIIPNWAKIIKLPHKSRIKYTNQTDDQEPFGIINYKDCILQCIPNFDDYFCNYWMRLFP